MRTISVTSKQAFANILPQLSNKRQLVLDALGELGTADNNMIARQLGWPINRITGRVTELRKMGYVELAYKRTGEYGSTVKYWKITPPEDEYQYSLFDEKEAC